MLYQRVLCSSSFKHLYEYRMLHKILGSPIQTVVSVIYRDQCMHLQCTYLYVINIQIRNTGNVCTDLFILLKPQSELGYLG